MLTVIRKNQQVLMLIIAILTIIAFIWLYNPTDKFRKFGTNDVISIYGRVIQQAEIDRMARGYRLALALGLTDFVRDLGGMGADEAVSYSDFIINLLVVQHQAPELGIRPSDEAVANVIKSLPALQTDGVFDPAKYAAFLQEQLGPNGFSELQMEEIIRDSLKVKELHRVIVSTVAIGEGEVREAARIYQPIDAQIVKFDRDAYLKSANVTTEEVATFYSKNKAGLQSRETRDVTYVSFDLPATQQKLTGKELAAAQQRLAEQAEQAVKAIRDGISKGSDFSRAATTAAQHPKKVGALERDGSVKGKDSVPASVATAAFRLQKTGELSNIIQDGNSFYIISVDGVTPAHQLELSEVGDKISSLLKQQRASQAATLAATKAMDQIRAAMASGKSFADAVKAAGVTTISLSGVTPSDAKLTPEQQALASATLSLNEGQLGSLSPAPWGAFAPYLVKRASLTDAQWKEHKAILSSRLLNNERELLFMEWLRSSRAAAQIKMMGRNSGAAGTGGS
jgi:hypothetical protein